ncbi:hypothetical protein B0H19DRAFT_1183597 [Mycena capillaripes]|nr:hypothetical protein B0H19DRAFT_1183597 [Mycena capillaripes]
MTYVPPESTSPTQPAHSAHTPVLLRIESISVATSLLAPFRPYALNPLPNPTRRVCLYTCGGVIRGAYVTTRATSSHGNDVVGMPLSIYALRPVLLHAAAPLLPCLRPSSLTPPPFSPMLWRPWCPDANIHTSHKLDSLPPSLGSTESLSAKQWKEIFHLHAYLGCRTLRHSLFVCSTPGLSPCRSFLPFPPKLFPLTSSPGIRRILDSTPRHNVSMPLNAVLWNGYTGCSVYTTKRPGLLQRRCVHYLIPHQHSVLSLSPLLHVLITHSISTDPPTTHHCVRASIPPRTLSHRRRLYSMAVPHSTRFKRTLCAVLSPYPIAQRRNALVSALPRFISPSEATSSKPSAAVGVEFGSPRSSSSIDSAATRFRRHVRHSSRRAQLRKFGPVWEHTGLLCQLIAPCSTG